MGVSFDGTRQGVIVRLKAWQSPDNVEKAYRRNKDTVSPKQLLTIIETILYLLFVFLGPYSMGLATSGVGPAYPPAWVKAWWRQLADDSSRTKHGIFLTTSPLNGQ